MANPRPPSSQASSESSPSISGKVGGGSTLLIMVVLENSLREGKDFTRMMDSIKKITDSKGKAALKAMMDPAQVSFESEVATIRGLVQQHSNTSPKTLFAQTSDDIVKYGASKSPNKATASELEGDAKKIKL